MWKLLSVALLLTLLPGSTSAEVWEQHNGQGYAYFAPGRLSGGSTMLHFGAGGEGFFYKGLAAGGEIGYLAPAQCLTYGVGLLSVNGSYHLNRDAHWKVAPFVTAGYSLAFRGGSENLFNVGGGLSYWLSDRTGLRLEFRDYVYPADGATHSVEFRIAVAFR